MKQPTFKYSFVLRPRVVKSGTKKLPSWSYNDAFYSLVYDSFECNRNSPPHGGIGYSIRFTRWWTEKQFKKAVKDIFKHGYTLDDVYRKPLPPLGIPQGENILRESLYTGF